MNILRNSRLAYDVLAYGVGIVGIYTFVERGNEVSEVGTLRYGSRSVPHRNTLLTGVGGNLVDSSVADPACGIVDDTLESLFVVWIYDKAEVGYHILYLLALIETHATVDLEIDAVAAQFFLEGAALGIGAVEYGEVVVGHSAVNLLFNVANDEGSLLAVRRQFSENQLITLFIA